MALADIIQSVKDGVNPELARLKSMTQKSPFIQRLTNSVKNSTEGLVRKAAGIDKMDLPEDFNATRGLVENIKEQVKAPIVSMLERAKEKEKMPWPQELKEHFKDAGGIIGEVAKAGGRVATTGIDAVQMAARNKIDPIDWEKIPLLKKVPSYQRQAQLYVEKGMEPMDVVSAMTRQISLDALTLYGTAKTVGKLDKMISGGNIAKSTKSLRTEMDYKTRSKVISRALESGDFKKSDIFVKKNSTIVKPNVAEGRLRDYALNLERESGIKGIGKKLADRIDINKVHFKDGKFVEIHREANRLLKDTKLQSATEAGAISNLSTKRKYDSSIGTTPEPRRVKLPTVDSYNPTTKKEALDAAKEIQRQAEDLYIDGKITKAELQTARNQVKLNESF